MTIPTDVMAEMASIGLSPEQARAVAGFLTRVEEATKAEAEQVIEAGRERGRERWKRWDEKRRSNVGKREQTLVNVNRQLAGGDARVEDKTLTSEIEPQKEEKKETRERFSDFEIWYRTYPHKVQRGAAEKAWPRARGMASLETLLAGVQRYIASKPADRPYQNPSTWLNGKGWMDEPAAPPQARASPSKINPTYLAALNLQDELDAVTPSEIEGHHPPPRLVAVGQR